MPNFGNDIPGGYGNINSAPNIIFGSPGTNIGLPVLSGMLYSSSVYVGDNMLGPFNFHMAVYSNAAGRPLINAVGKPRVVINGTCLDFLAESFMAGNPLNGGGDRPAG